MQFLYKITLIGLGLALLSACATPAKTYIIPKTEGQYIARGISSDQNIATEAALSNARSVCDNQGKTLEVLKIDTIYRGINQDVKVFASIASRTATMNGVPGVTPNLSNDNDYEINVDFQCR